MMSFGLSLSVGSFGMNIYLTQFIFALVELLARLVTLPLIGRFGRRACQAVSTLMGAIACLCLFFVPKGDINVQQFLETRETFHTGCMLACGTGIYFHVQVIDQAHYHYPIRKLKNQLLILAVLKTENLTIRALICISLIKKKTGGGGEGQFCMLICSEKLK